MEQIAQLPDEDPQESLPDLLDPEAHLLCALMHTSRDDDRADYIFSYLAPGDFYQPAYERFFAILQELHGEGKSFTAANVLAQIMRSEGKRADVYSSQLVGVSTLGAVMENALSLADDILSTSYRRQFRRLGERLVHAAEYAAEADLFDTLVEQGKLQRRAWQRRQGFMEGWKVRST